MRIIAGILFFVAASSCDHAPARPKNLLLVTLDSVRPERFEEPEAYCELPLALAHFAAEATRFRGCIASAPGTLPAAASMMTGRYPRELGHPAPGRRLPEGVPTLAEVLRDAGFETAAFVGPATLRSESGIARGFDLYVEPTESARNEDYETTDTARDWLCARQGSSRPWFVWVHLNAGHGPYRALETPFNPLHFFYKYSVLPRDGAREIPIVRGNSGRGGIPSYQKLTTPARFGAYRTYYDARVRVGDWFANELRHVLRVTDQYDSTVISIVGTHGEALGEHGIEFDHGENLHREVLEVPLLIGVPGREASTVEGIVSQVDLFTTLLGALGLAAGETSGRDLFEGGSRVAFSELYSPIGPESMIAATTDGAKLVQIGAAALAYDLERDPAERAPEPAGESELSSRLRAFAAIEPPAAERAPLGTRDRAHLRNLGYVMARFER